MKCPICGKEEKPYYDDSSIKERGECVSCHSWRKRLPLVKNSNVAIIDGTFYTIGDENDPSSCRGFGGDKFVINFKDGRQVTTTNLWCIGDIPEYWKPQFPDNADFNWKWEKSPCGMSYLVPKETEEIPDSLIAQAETNIGM